MKIIKLIIISIFLSLSALSSGSAEEINEKEIGEVVVSSTMTEKELEDAPGSVEIISYLDIKKIGATTLSQALEDGAGLIIKSESGRVKTLDIRGTGAKHTLVLLDGKRFSSGFRDILDLNQIPVEMIERVEIIRGASSALYGSDAIGGVVNIITKKAKDDFIAELNFRYSQDKYIDGHSTRYGAYAGEKIERLGYSLSGSIQRTNQYEHDNISPDDGDNTSLGSIHGSFNFDMNDKNSIEAGLFYSLFKGEGIRDFQGMDRLRTANDKRLSYNLSYIHNNNEKFKSSLFFNHSEYENNIKMNPFASDFNALKHSTDEVGIRINSHLGKQLITGGSDFRKEVRQELSLSDDDISNLGVFIQDEFFLNDNFYFVAGLRYDDHSQAGDYYAPRSSLVYKPIKDLSLKASYGKGFRAPALSELFSTSYKKRGKEVFSPNKDLSPEESSSYEFSILCKYKIVSGELTYYKNHIDDLIYAKFVKSEGSGKKKVDYYIYDNLKSTTTSGYEAKVDLKLLKSLNLSAKISTCENDDLENLDYLKGQLKVSDNLEKLGLNWNFRANYYGELKDGEGKDLEGYTTYHIYLAKNVFRKCEIFAGIDNLFDKSSSDHIIDPATYYLGISFEY